MSKIIFANCNTLLNEVQQELASRFDSVCYTKKEELSSENVALLNPSFIFFLHWSWLIPQEIFNNYQCVVFHMTDLPYGRGGSPLQNLILRGHKTTKISALKVDSGLDTGDIYLKKELSLLGTASEIFLDAGNIMHEMVIEILSQNHQPVQQTGEVVTFSRRKPFQSIISNEIEEIEDLYDFIRMLDAPNYPHAFLETQAFKFEFTAAELNNNNHELLANVRIIKK